MNDMALSQNQRSRIVTWLFGIGGLVTAATLTAVILTGSADGAGTENPTPKAAQGPFADSLADEVASSFRRSEVMFKPDSNQQVKVSAEEAVVAAASSLGFLNTEDGDADAAVLGYLTAADVKAENRLVWLVTFDGFTEPMFGPLDSRDERTSEAGFGRMWVAIDPENGDFLGAKSIALEEEPLPPTPSTLKPKPTR